MRTDFLHDTVDNSPEFSAVRSPFFFQRLCFDHPKNTHALLFIGHDPKRFAAFLEGR
jgi:hypothetical protein